MDTRTLASVVPSTARRAPHALRRTLVAVTALLAVAGTGVVHDAPAALAQSAPAPTSIRYSVELTPAGVADYRSHMGLSPTAGLPGARGAGIIDVYPTIARVQTVMLSVDLVGQAGRARFECGMHTPSGLVSFQRIYPPFSSGTTTDAFSTTSTVVTMIERGDCYVVVVTALYPNGAIAGQIVPLSTVPVDL